MHYIYILIRTWQSLSQKSASTVLTIRKAQNNTVNTCINTESKKHFTHSHLLYDYTQTPAHSHSPPHKHEHACTHTHAHIHTHTHTHTHTVRQTHTPSRWKSGGRNRLSCWSHALQPPPPPAHAYGDNFIVSGEGMAEEVHFEAGFKDMRDGNYRVCIGTEFHTQGA